MLECRQLDWTQRYSAGDKLLAEVEAYVEFHELLVEVEAEFEWYLT